jgi:hypothetical protein
MPGIKDGALNVADNIPAPFKPTWQEWFREFESISAVGYFSPLQPCPGHVRSTPRMRHSPADVGLSRRKWVIWHHVSDIFLDGAKKIHEIHGIEKWHLKLEPFVCMVGVLYGYLCAVGRPISLLSRALYTTHDGQFANGSHNILPTFRTA